MSFFAELKRRNVVRVGFAYIVISWLLAQVAEFAFENFGAPEWVLKTFVVVLLLGLPLVLDACISRMVVVERAHATHRDRALGAALCSSRFLETNNMSRPRPAALQPLLREGEVAELLGVSVRTLQEWRQSGHGPPFLKLSQKKRGVVRYEPVDLRSFMVDQKVRSTAERSPWRNP